ncbi:phage tail tip lysozyme [Microvirga sp. TS319]|uniref:phage tail tip lysozyme n=1 Tax=Microvirga sp. TS319 TaxID=3241165 RepID=UPI00351A7E0C
MTDIFRTKAPKVMADLMRDFPLDADDAAAILGNLGHECSGFRSLQEREPLVKGSRGGYGWSQWTGPRRRAYEAFCTALALDPASDRANYGFLLEELKGSEKRAVPAVKQASGLRDKVIAFEKAFLRAGIKHYDSRLKWAEEALRAWADHVPQPPDIEPIDPPKTSRLGALLRAFFIAMRRRS